MFEDIEIIHGLTDELICSIAEIEERCFSDPWSRQAFIEASGKDDDYFFCVALCGGKPVGFGCLNFVLDEATVLNIATLSEYRRRGIGKRILSELISEAEKRGVGVVMLEVRESNSAAIALYSGFGFYTVGKRKNYYRKPVEDAVLMDKRLKTD